jgi:uncharacterized protein
MSRQTKSSTELAAAVIDSLEFAREGRTLDGVIAVSGLRRLADVLVEPVGELRCSLRGTPSQQRRDGKPGLELEVSGTVRLRCQRCLQVMDFPLEVACRLLPIASGEPWPDEDEDEDGAGSELDDEWDAIEASREQSVLALIEDEVLLALPIVPRHEACEPPVAMNDEHEPSPFAALAKLKQQ